MKLVLVGVIVCAVAISYSQIALAESPQSPNYRFDESSIGVSSILESSSANFRAQGGAGDTASGEGSSDNFQTELGSRTSPDPNLTLSVDAAQANFGSFSAATPATAEATFSITNYTAYGYVVQLAGDPPKNGNETIDSMGATATSQPGVEQFGLNLVANTVPLSFGNNPDNGTAPNNFGFGEPAPNYATPNQFRYVSGETIARAPKSSGKTIYTMSYLVNVASLTPGGIYSSDQTLIVTGTY